VSAFDVLVVGGGQSGLAIGYHLRQRGLRFEILEAEPTIGSVWRSRWESLRLFTSAQYASLPGLPFPAAAAAYPTKDEVADYLRIYAATFDLPVRLSTRVVALWADTDGYMLATQDETLQARNVVVATGPFQAPAVPSLAARLDDAVTQLHSSEFHNANQLPEGPVLVVGGGNSGFQIAAELATDRTVDLSVGTQNFAIPQKPLGRDIFWWLTTTGFMTCPPDSFRGRLMRRGEGTVIGVTRHDLRRAGIRLRPRLTKALGRTVTFADDATLRVTTVVWATGFRRDYSWIAVREVFDDQGLLLQHRGVTPARGLYFLGLPWQSSAGSALLGFVQRDAAKLVDHIAVGYSGRRDRNHSKRG
jgi:putative flavoprotein involved in K+ transport